MGIQDRDYYREGPSFLDRVGQQGATVWLIAITCGIFFGQVMSGGLLTAMGVTSPKLILEGEVWRLFTAMFLHRDLVHLFFNMLTLYWVGQRLEDYYGPREFVLFYLLSGVGANVLYLSAQVAGLAPGNPTLGASGAVTAAFVLFVCHWPHAQVRLWFLLPLPAWLLAVLYVGYSTVSGFGNIPVNGQGLRGGGTAHLAHLGGAVLGLLYYQAGVRFSNLFPRQAQPARVRPKLRVVPPAEERTPEPVGVPVEAPPRPASAPDEQLEAKLDAVLEKMSKYGQDSLTAEEREILFKASELYKKRRK